jgi:hypothetical protein
LVDTAFVELVSDKSFLETCIFLSLHAIGLDQQYTGKAARQCPIIAGGRKFDDLFYHFIS